MRACLQDDIMQQQVLFNSRKDMLQIHIDLSGEKPLRPISQFDDEGAKENYRLYSARVIV